MADILCALCDYLFNPASNPMSRFNYFPYYTEEQTEAFNLKLERADNSPWASKII